MILSNPSPTSNSSSPSRIIHLSGPAFTETEPSGVRASASSSTLSGSPSSGAISRLDGNATALAQSETESKGLRYARVIKQIVDTTRAGLRELQLHSPPASSRSPSQGQEEGRETVGSGEEDELLKFMRIRTGRYELMISPGESCQLGSVGPRGTCLDS